MIVKDESEVIKSTLENITSYVELDTYVICDTGSSDNTIQIIKDFFESKNIPGEVFQDEWKNFGYNRNLALNYAQGKSDYILIFDADDRISGNFNMPDLNADIFDFRFVENGLVYFRPLLIKNSGNFVWRGVVHEYLTPKSDSTRELIDGDYHIAAGHFGNRSKNYFETFKKDLALLLNGYYSDKEDFDLKPRYSFYIANTYKAMCKYDESIEWYHKRIEHSGWIDEVTKSYEYIGECYENQGNDEKAIHYWLLGYDFNPNRAECIYRAIAKLNKKGYYNLGYQLSKIAKQIKKPEFVQFLDDYVYDYKLDFEIQVLAWHNQQYLEGYQSCKHVLRNSSKLEILEQTINNLYYYKQQLLEDTRDEQKQILHILKRQSKSTKSDELIKLLDNII